MGLSLKSVLEAISIQAGVFKETKGLRCSREIGTLFPLTCNGAEASIFHQFLKHAQDLLSLEGTGINAFVGGHASRNSTEFL